MDKELFDRINEVVCSSGSTSTNDMALTVGSAIMRTLVGFGETRDLRKIYVNVNTDMGSVPCFLGEKLPHDAIVLEQWEYT